jgi:nascent polypeptide-associated complex subunit alpha
MAPPAALVAAAENNAQLAKLMASTRIGGKGTVRRKTKRVSARPAYDEKKLAASLQKLGISSVPGIEEATLMTSDGELLSFSNAKVSASVQANTCVISGNVTVTQVDKPAAAADKAEVVEEIVAEEEAKPKAEEEKDDSDTDDDMPDLDEAADGKPDGKGHKQTKHEKKVRKALSGIGLKDAAGFSQMAVRNGKSMMLIIKNPDVMKVTSGKGGATYAVFGKVEVEDANAKQQQAQQLMEQIRAMQEKQGAKEGGEDDSDDECPDLAEVTFGEEEKAEIGDLSEDDVKLVIDQAGVSRNKAISALKENDGDVVNAIMSLSDS